MNDFDKLMQEIEAEAEAEGPEAVAQLEAFGAYFTRAARQLSMPPLLTGRGSDADR